MHRGTPSPIFDVPEFPTLRRVKPLPKRRRTTTGTGKGGVMSLSSALGVDAKPFFEQLAQQGFTITGHAATAEELIGEGDELIGSISLENYYMPPNIQSFLAANGVDPGGPNGSRNGRNGSNTAAAAAAAALSAVTNGGRNGQMPLPLSDLNSLEFGVHFAAAAAAAAAAGVAMGGLGSLGLGLAGMNLGNAGITMNGGTGGTGNTGVGGGGGRSRDEDDGRGDGDMDHLRQPGNTKKRKVPANMSPRSGGIEGGARPGSPSSGYMDDEGVDPSMEGEGRSAGDDELQLQFQRERERDRDRDRERSFSPNHSNTHSHSQTHSYPPAPFPGQLSMVAQKRGKLMAATLAGLQHKELLKSRKRQLAAVMGALSHGDTLALDQALTGASYGYRGYGSSGMLGKGNLIAGTAGEDQQAQGFSVRKSKRRTIRLARAMKIALAMPQRRIRHPDAVPFPQADFRFSCPSGTADRLIATKEEVANLRKRFEVELEKQAAKAAKMAVAAATAAATGHAGVNAGGGTGGDGTGKVVKATGGKGKRERQERDRERAERAQAQMQAQAQMKIKDENVAPSSVATVTTTTNASVTPSGNGTGEFSAPGSAAVLGGGGKPKNGKKKKRSTLANASNPHHLKNYVPSRLPHSGDGGNAGGIGGYGGVSPLPIRFLSSEIPPRRKRGQGKKDRGGSADGGTPHRGTPTSQGAPGGHYGGQPASAIPLKNPGEEWICAFCEYDLFYGGEAAYRRAVRNRKKILRRRRRARERAARAASGKTGVASHHPPAPPPSEEGDEEEEYEEEGVADVQGTGNGQGLRAGRWKGGRGPDG